MSIGIYKITNLINQKIYIGQSSHIEQRWKEHCRNSSSSLISKAIKKYGKENFSFEIIELCLEEELDEKEAQYIKIYNSIVPNGYNVILESKVKNQIFFNYDFQILNNILNDIEETQDSFQEIANRYNLNLSTIYYLNRGDYHSDENRNYPLRKVKDFSKHYNYCIDCGKEINLLSIRCQECYKKNRLNNIPSRDIIKKLIKEKSFTEIGKEYNVTGNAVVKWCKYYKIPHKKEEIKKYSKEEWELI